VHRIRGKVLDASGSPVPKVPVTLAKGFGPILHQVTGRDGTFEFVSVPDDEWRLSTSMNKDNKEWRAAKLVHLKNDDVENAELRLGTPFSIQGKLVVEVPEGLPAPKLPGVTVALAAAVSLLSDPQDGRFLTSDSDGKGGFTIENVYPGPYYIVILPESPLLPYYLDAVSLGGQDVFESDVRNLSDAQPLTITYKLGGGTVRGVIDACGGGQVLLIPRDPGSRSYLRRGTSCAHDGRFEFSAVRPGEYYGLAISGDSPWTAAYHGVVDDDLLKRASRVSVRGNEITSAEIPLITR
jgi:hypothetical protein